MVDSVSQTGNSHKKTSRGDGNVLYLILGNDSKSVYTFQNLSNCTLIMCILNVNKVHLN